MTRTRPERKSPSEAACWAALFCCAALCAAETVPVKIGGQAVQCEVVKVTKDGAVLKTGGKEQTIPLEKLDPKDVARCYKAVPPPASAAGRLEMGSYFLKHQLFDEAEEELTAAGKADAACKARAAPMLAAIRTLKEISAGRKSGGGKTGDEGEAPGAGEGQVVTVDIAKAFKAREVPPKSPTELKAFLDKRLEELKSIGGTWRMIETKHFCCFANVPEAKHRLISQWNEGLYERLCQVLRHKEGDKLWNNKMPMYYFSNYSQFQNFAATIDHSLGAAHSGGYFAAEGREVHTCIPFMTERFNNEKTADRMARNTLHHECTHAFLQLTGENVRLSRWLHEGLAQFIEFWYDRENTQEGRDNSPEKRQRVALLQQCLARNQVPTWAEMKDRPMGGTDTGGYAFAWSKLEFLYRNFDNQKLPQMIRLIKSGQSDEAAMAAAFGLPVDRLEEAYRVWLKAQVKRGFNFGP